MLLSLLFFSVVASPVDWNSPSPVVDAMADRASSILHVKVMETSTGDLKEEIHDSGFRAESTASASVIDVLKGTVEPGSLIYFKWENDPEPSSDHDRIHKGGEYIVFITSDRTDLWTPPEGPPAEIHYLIDPVVGFQPYDSFLFKMLKYHLKNSLQN